MILVVGATGQSGMAVVRKSAFHALAAQPSMKTDGHGRRPARAAVFKSEAMGPNWPISCSTPYEGGGSFCRPDRSGL